MEDLDDLILQENDETSPPPAGSWLDGDAGAAYIEPTSGWMGDCSVDPDGW